MFQPALTQPKWSYLLVDWKSNLQNERRYGWESSTVVERQRGRSMSLLKARIRSQMFKKRRTEGHRVTLLPKQPSFSTTKLKTNNENDLNIEFNSEYYGYQGLAYRRGACSWAKRKNITFISKWITFPNRITKAKKSHCCLHSHAIKLKQKALTRTHMKFFDLNFKIGK